MSKCDLCSTPIFLDSTAISSEDLRQAVFNKGFTPWKAGIRSDLISPDVETFWKQNVAQDQSDWHICPSCMKKLSPYLTGKPKATGIASWAISQNKDDLSQGLADAEARYIFLNLLEYARQYTKDKKRQTQLKRWLQLMGLPLLIMGLVGLVTALTTNWAAIPLNPETNDDSISINDTFIVTRDGEFAIPKTVMETNILVGAVLFGGLGLVAAAGLLMVDPAFIHRLRLKQPPEQMKTRQMAALGSALILAATLGYAFVSNNQLEVGWRNVAFVGGLAALFSALRWFLPEIEIPEKKIVEKKVAPPVKEEPIEDEEDEEEEHSRRDTIFNILSLLATIATLILVAFALFNNKSDDSSDEAASSNTQPQFNTPTSIHLEKSQIAAQVTTAPTTEILPPTWTAVPTSTDLIPSDTPYYTPTLAPTAIPSITPSDTPTLMPTNAASSTQSLPPTPFPSINASNAIELQAIPSCYHNNYVNAVVFSPDGEFVITGDEDGNVNLWKTGDCEYTPLKILGKHSYGVHSLAFSADGQLLASGALDIKVWNFKTSTLKSTFTFDDPSAVGGLTFSPDGKWLVSGSVDHQLRIWDVETEELVKVVDTSQYVYGVTFSPDGQLLATCLTDGNRGTVQLWEANTWRKIKQLEISSGLQMPIAFSPDGKWLAAGGYQQIRVWNTSDFNLETEYSEGYYGFSVAFSPDSSLLVSGSAGTVRIMDIRTWTQVQQIQANGDINAVVFSPDGTWLVAGTQGASAFAVENQLHLWHVGD